MEFREFFGTHGDRPGYFFQPKYEELIAPLKEVTRPVGGAASQAAAAERQAEKTARMQARGAQGEARGKGGKGAQVHQKVPPPNFKSEVIKTAKALQAQNKMPCIIFCMSRAKCVEGAHALAGINLIHGTKAKPAPDKDEDPVG